MTTQEIMDKQAKFETELATALEASKVIAPGTPEFDEAYTRYLTAKTGIARIPDEIAAAKLIENAEAIKTAGDTVAEALTQLIEGLKVADLLGTPVIALRYYRVVKVVEGKPDEVSTGTVFNPIMKLASAKGSKKSGAGRTVIIDGTGDKLSLTKFVLNTATEAEKASPEYKYPHTRVDSKPKFEEYCKAHSLTGYAYELPGTTETTPEAS